jgi:light-regulated signal transduction histidine kinase (bacteriophytochrome)
MSHELRTPLNAIGGYAELLELGLRGPVTDAQRLDLERLRRANQHMSGLVEAVLSFARVEAGRVEYRVEDVRLGPLVADLEALVGPQLAAAGLAYDHDGCGPETPERPHVARADAEKVRQVLLNLLTNAVKFTAPAAAWRSRASTTPPPAWCACGCPTRGAGSRPTSTRACSSRSCRWTGSSGTRASRGSAWAWRSAATWRAAWAATSPARARPAPARPSP